MKNNIDYRELEPEQMYELLPCESDSWYLTQIGFDLGGKRYLIEFDEWGGQHHTLRCDVLGGRDIQHEVNEEEDAKIQKFFEKLAGDAS